MMPRLTIGMATYRDFHGVYFTLQALRIYHQLPPGTELLVIDTFGEPGAGVGCRDTRSATENVDGRYIHAPQAQGTAASRDLVFHAAEGEIVLCCDCHVLFEPRSIEAVLDYYERNPESRDLVQGPLVYDDGVNLATHFKPVWNEHMWGVWDLDGRVHEGRPFDIPMQGLGVFAMRKAAWPGFNRHFRGFGGEEGYLHEKVRQRGGRTICLPALRWRHRFGRPEGVPYRLQIVDRIVNYLIGHRELGLDEQVVLEHFRDKVQPEEMEMACIEVNRILPSAGRNPRYEITRNAPEVAQSLPESTSDVIGAVPSIIRTKPLISCLCPTFGRGGTPHQYLLEEAIESFLHQSDEHAELVVLNDHPGQQLVFAHPRVHIVNLSRRFRTLGEKYNALVGLAQGDILAPWEDDDISLPHRLELSRDLLGEADYFNPKRYWFLDPNGLHDEHGMGVGHNLSLFRRRVVMLVGGYPMSSGDQDAIMDSRLHNHAGLVVAGCERDLPVEKWYYIYRWGVSPVHLSGKTPHEAFYAEIGNRPAPHGTWPLSSHWHSDYAGLVEARLRQRNPAR